MAKEPQSKILNQKWWRYAVVKDHREALLEMLTIASYAKQIETWAEHIKQKNRRFPSGASFPFYTHEVKSKADMLLIHARSFIRLLQDIGVNPEDIYELSAEIDDSVSKSIKEIVDLTFQADIERRKEEA